MSTETDAIATSLAGFAPKLPVLAIEEVLRLDTRLPGRLPVTVSLSEEQMRQLSELYSAPPTETELYAQLAQLKNNT